MHLYIGCNGHVAAIDPSTGDEVWRTKLLGTLGKVHSDVCILEHEGRLLVGCHGHAFGLEAATGKILWKNELEGLGYNHVTLSMAGKSIQHVSGR